MPGIRGEIRLRWSGLTLFGVIGTVWRMGTAVFGLCDAAKRCQCFRGVSMPPSGANACGTLLGHEAMAGLALRGSTAPTPTSQQLPRNMDTFCRPAAPRATMAA